MIRSLLLIAVAGFVLSMVSFTLAVSIGGPEALARGAWGWGGHSGWDWDWDDDDRHDGWGAADGPTSTRELTWSGGDSVEFDVPADITFTQAPGPAKITVTGPARAVERVVVDGDEIRFRGRTSRWGRMTIVMSAPNITSFGINGSDRLTIENYDQPRLKVDISGSAKVTARGKARDIDVDISGSGEAYLGELAAQGAEVDISGSGEATVAPTEWARLDISGSGEITLATRPARVESDISGSGSIRQGSDDRVRDDDRIVPPAPPTPAPPPTPGAKT